MLLVIICKLDSFYLLFFEYVSCYIGYLECVEL